MSAQDTKKQIDWMLRLAQISSMTIATLVATEFVCKRWGAIVQMLGLG